jgi:hypothetical protein
MWCRVKPQRRVCETPGLRVPSLVESGLDVKQGGGMSWSYDAGSPQRDTSASVEDDAAALFGQPTRIAWRDKLVRLWRLLARR